jgi:hypothetical protein
MGRRGGLGIASLLLLIGSIAGISGLIEQIAYTTTFHLGLILAHLPEIIIQTLLLGYVLLAWELRVESRLGHVGSAKGRLEHPRDRRSNARNEKRYRLLFPSSPALES